MGDTNIYVELESLDYYGARTFLWHCTVKYSYVTTPRFYVKAIFIYIEFMMKIKSRKCIKIIDYHFKL